MGSSQWKIFKYEYRKILYFSEIIIKIKQGLSFKFGKMVIQMDFNLIYLMSKQSN